MTTTVVKRRKPKGRVLPPAEARQQTALQRVRQLLYVHRKELLLVALLLAISITAHAWNMLHFPYIENDEATYTSRAWAFIHQGRLDVYTYRYDHAPLGWMFIGLWHVLTGGTALFGSYIVSGRVLMLVLHTISTVLLYLLTKRFTNGNKTAAVVAVLVFSLSPLALYFQRRILLDNIMTFWVLLSMYLATQPKHRLKHYLWSGFLFGVAVLTKLNAIFFAPAYLYIIWRKAHKAHRMHAMLYWLFIAGAVISCFFLFALLKGELMQAPLDAAGNPTHVSVVETFKLQLGRGEFVWPWLPDSSLRQNINSWVLKDWFILAGGTTAAVIVGVLAYVRRRTYPLLMGLVLAFWAYFAFLSRGKLVIDLYVVPFIPFLAAVIGALVGMAASAIPRRKSLRAEYYLALLCVGILVASTVPYKQYFNNETANQQSGLTWIEQHVPKDAIIAADNYVYPYLAQERGYKNVSYFFSTEYDPEVRSSYGDDWRNIEYVVVTHEVVSQIKTGTVPKMRYLLEHAELVADYRANTTSYLDIPKYISTNGDWVQVYRVKSRGAVVQQDSWKYFKNTFIKSYGQVVEPANNDLTTSIDQAQAMLRAIEQNDEDMFRGVWQWSKDHIRYRKDDVLLSWRWEKTTDGQYRLADSNNDCGADQVVALSLYKADERWPGGGYGQEAAQHTADWWRKCVFSAGNRLYVDSSADGSRGVRLVNPSYFNPDLYRYLATQYPTLPWQQLITDGYGASNAYIGTFGTMPTWANISATGAVTSAAPVMGPDADRFGYGSLQLVRLLAADSMLHAEPAANALLARLDAPMQEFGAANTTPAYSVARLMYLQAMQPDSPDVYNLYDTVLYQPYDTKSGKWFSGDYYEQVWLWQWYSLQGQIPKGSQIQLK